MVKKTRNYSSFTTLITSGISFIKADSIPSSNVTEASGQFEHAPTNVT